MTLLMRVTRKVFLCVFVWLIFFSSAWGEEVQGEEEVYKMLQLFGEVLDDLEKRYVDSVDRKQLIEEAIRGTLGSLDPHTVLLSPESYSSLRESTSGRFGGLGIEIDQAEGGGVKVVSPIKDTPADKAGLEPNDVITAVDGLSILDKTLNEAIGLMKGEEGSSVELTFLREGEEMKVVIVRSVIKVRSVRSWLEGDVGYVRLLSFNSNASSDIKEAVEALKLENKDIFGYVLDLRRNPGGLLDQALKVSDLFLEHGEIVSVRSEHKDRRDASRFHAHKGDVTGGLPLVVLMDGGSASASEIVAGALKDHERAILVGERSYGKGSVQDVLDLGVRVGMPANTYGIKMTVQRYFTPSGVSIDGSGLAPDVEVFTDSDMGSLGAYVSEERPEDVQLAYALREVKRLSEYDRLRGDSSRDDSSRSDSSRDDSSRSDSSRDDSSRSDSSRDDSSRSDSSRDEALQGGG